MISVRVIFISQFILILLFVFLVYSVSQKVLLPCSFLTLFFKRLRICNRDFTHLLHVHIHTKLQNVVQLTPTLTKLCRTKYDHPSVQTFAKVTWCSTHLTTVCGVQCFRHSTNFTQSQRSFQSQKVHCSRSGMTCHRQRSTMLSTTFANVCMRFGRTCWTILAYHMKFYRNILTQLFAVS